MKPLEFINVFKCDILKHLLYAIKSCLMVFLVYKAKSSENNFAKEKGHWSVDLFELTLCGSLMGITWEITFLSRLVRQKLRCCCQPLAVMQNIIEVNLLKNQCVKMDHSDIKTN